MRMDTPSAAARTAPVSSSSGFSPRQLPASVPASVAEIDSHRYLNTQTRQPQIVVAQLKPLTAAEAIPLSVGGPQKCGAGVPSASSLPTMPSPSDFSRIVPPQQKAIEAERLRELSQVSDDAKGRSVLIKKIALHQAHESAARIGRQRAMDSVAEAKLAAQRKIVFERRETDVLHREQMERDDIHRERSTSFLELTLQLREQQNRERRETVASSEAAWRAAIVSEYTNELQALTLLATSHSSFAMRASAIRESEAAVRRQSIEALERSERLQLRRQFSVEWFGVLRVLCQNSEDMGRAKLLRVYEEEQMELESRCRTSAEAAQARTHARFGRERAALEVRENEARCSISLQDLSDAEDALARCGQAHLFTARCSQQLREEREARKLVEVALQSALDILETTKIKQRTESVALQQLREKEERSSLVSSALLDLGSIITSEAAERKTQALQQLTEWSCVNGGLQRQDMAYSEQQGRSSIVRDYKRLVAQLEAQAACSAQRVELWLNCKCRTRQISGEEEDTRDLLAAAAAASRAVSLQRERERLAIAAEQARIQALRALAQRSAPFIGLSLAEKVSTSSVDKRVKDAASPNAHLLVDSLVANGPAYAAGVRLLDRVMSVAGVWSTSLAAVRATIAHRAVVGSQIEIRVKRPPQQPDDHTTQDGDGELLALDHGSSDAKDAEQQGGGSGEAILTFLVDVKTIDEQFREILEWFYEMPEASGGSGSDRIERGSASPGYSTRRRRSIIDKMGPPKKLPEKPQSPALVSPTAPAVVALPFVEVTIPAPASGQNVQPNQKQNMVVDVGDPPFYNSDGGAVVLAASAQSQLTPDSPLSSATSTSSPKAFGKVGDAGVPVTKPAQPRLGSSGSSSSSPPNTTLGKAGPTGGRQTPSNVARRTSLR